MKMGKKIIAFTLAAMLILSFAGCGEKTDNNSSSEVYLSDSSASATESKSKSDNSGEITFNSGEITLENVLNHETSPESDFNFSKDGEGNSGVLSYSGSDSIVVIPETYEGLPVTKIEKYAFSNKETPKAIKFADSVTEIDEGACVLNKGLEIVVMGKNTKVIGEGAFVECSSLREVSLNEGLEKISTIAFANCPNLKSITIPKSVVEIEFGAFTGTGDIIIYGTAGSVAEEFAKEAGIEFVAQ